MASISKACGGKNTPSFSSGPSGNCAAVSLPSSCGRHVPAAIARASSSITGPISVARSNGSPSVSSSIAPRIMSSILSATSSCRNSTRKREQRWPALSKADAITSRATCSGSAVESTIIAFMPPVSATMRGNAPSRAASARLMTTAVSVDPVNATPARRGSPNRRVADLRATARQADAAHRPARPPRCSSRTAAAAISGVCSAGLARTVLPAAKRARNLPGENRQRKIPRRDAGERRRGHAAKARCLRPSDPGSLIAPSNCARARDGVIAQEGRSPRALRQAHWATSCRLAHSERHQMRAVRSKQIGGAFQDLRRALHRPARPIRAARGGNLQRIALHRRRSRFDDFADYAPAIRRIEHGIARALSLSAAHDRSARVARFSSAIRMRRDDRRADRRDRSTESRDEFLRPGKHRSRLAIRGLRWGCAGSQRATGSATISSTGDLSSASRLTKDVLAPFSSSRRTR